MPEVEHVNPELSDPHLEQLLLHLLGQVVSHVVVLAPQFGQWSVSILSRKVLIFDGSSSC